MSTSGNNTAHVPQRLTGKPPHDLARAHLREGQSSGQGPGRAPVTLKLITKLSISSYEIKVKCEPTRSDSNPTELNLIDPNPKHKLILL